MGCVQQVQKTWKSPEILNLIIIKSWIFVEKSQNFELFELLFKGFIVKLQINISLGVPYAFQVNHIHNITVCKMVEHCFCFFLVAGCCITERYLQIVMTAGGTALSQAHTEMKYTQRKEKRKKEEE